MGTALGGLRAVLFYFLYIAFCKLTFRDHFRYERTISISSSVARACSEFICLGLMT